MAGVVITIQGAEFGQVLQNHFAFAGVGTEYDADQLEAFAALANGEWHDSFMPILTTAYSFEQAIATSVETGVHVASAGGGNGGLGVSPAPSFVAASLVFRTLVPGVRGGTRVSGIAAAHLNSVNGNLLSDAARADLQVALDAFIAAMEEGDPTPTLEHVVISRQDAGLPRPTPLAFPVTGRTVSLAVGSQTSRKH